MTEPVVDPIWATDHAAEVFRLCEELRKIGCVVVAWSAEDIQARYKDMRENAEYELSQGFTLAADLEVPLDEYDITIERAQEILDRHRENLSRDAAESGESYLDYFLLGDPRAEKDEEVPHD